MLLILVLPAEDGSVEIPLKVAYATRRSGAHLPTPILSGLIAFQSLSVHQSQRKRCAGPDSSSLNPWPNPFSHPQKRRSFTRTGGCSGQALVSRIFGQTQFIRFLVFESRAVGAKEDHSSALSCSMKVSLRIIPFPHAAPCRIHVLI